VDVPDRDLLAVVGDGQHDEALLPLGVPDADHRGLGDPRVDGDGVPDVDGGDPLAADLDDVVQSVGDLRSPLQAARSWPCSNRCFGKPSYRLPGPAT
jgi:hypothetical protein